MLKILQPGFNNIWTVNFQMFKLVLERQRNQISNCQHPLDHRKSKRVPEEDLFLLYWLCQSPWLCGSQSTVENSERDGNTRAPDLLLEKPICRPGSNSLNGTWNNRLVPNRERSTSRRVYCDRAYLTYMQSTSCEMPGWVKHKLESRFLEKYQ